MKIHGGPDSGSITNRTHKGATRRFTASALALWCLLGFQASCGEERDGQCKVDQDCPNGQVCIDGQCTQRDPCAGVRCGEGQECVSGICVSKTCSETSCTDPPGDPACYDLPAPCQGGTCQYEPVVGRACNDQDACTQADICHDGGVCAGEPLVCEDPDPPYCRDAETLVVFATPGRCVDGACSYSPVQVPCPNGCANDECLGDPCQGVTCEEPPPPECVSANEVRTYSSPGTCSHGVCNYPFDDTYCPNGCENGACANDPCDGVVCDDPPPDRCIDPNTLRHYDSSGICQNGQCSYGYDDVHCDNGCENDRCADCTPHWTDTGPCECTPTECSGCTGVKHQQDGCGNEKDVACSLPPTGCMGTCCSGVCCPAGQVCSSGACCTPDCSSKSCGDDGCGGSCGNCDTPPPDTCIDDQNLWHYDTQGSCQQGQCSYGHEAIECILGCENGQCTSEKTIPYDWSYLSGNFYRYAGTVVESSGNRYLFFCGNTTSGTIQDHIIERTAYWNGTQWVYSAETVALSPGASGAWDQVHVCDPAVVTGQFWYRRPGETSQHLYNYALFYTGLDLERQDGGKNQIGWAVAESLDGPWYRVSVDVPLVSATQWWGVGQPDVTAVDGQGEVLLFYTRGENSVTQTEVAHLNLSDANNPLLLDPTRVVPTAGLTTLNGTQDTVLRGGAFMYDPSRDLFWVARNGNPDPSDCPSWVSTYVQIASIPASAIWGGSGSWTVFFNVTSSLMQTHRVFDPGFVKNPWGGLVDPGVLEALVSVNTSSDCANNQWLWTYRIQGIDLVLP